MKTAIILLSLFCFHTPPSTFLLVDKELKKPVGHVDEFTPESFRKGGFPVYSTDVDAIVAATDIAAKKINQGTTCETIDTIQAGRSTIYVYTRCQWAKTVSVLFVTGIPTENGHTDFSIELVKPDSDLRNVQRRLFDFATYLTK